MRVIGTPSTRRNLYFMAHALSAHVAKKLFGIDYSSGVVALTAWALCPITIRLLFKLPLAMMAFDISMLLFHNLLQYKTKKILL